MHKDNTGDNVMNFIKAYKLIVHNRNTNLYFNTRLEYVLDTTDFNTPIHVYKVANAS